MWNGCKTHQIWHTLRVIWNRNVGNQKIWNREIVSCRAGKSDVVVVGNRGLARPPQSGKAWWWPGFSTNGIAAFRLWTNESAGRGRAGRAILEKRLVGEVSDDNGKCSAGQSRLWSDYGSSSSSWRWVHKNNFIFWQFSWRKNTEQCLGGLLLIQRNLTKYEKFVRKKK